MIKNKKPTPLPNITFVGARLGKLPPGFISNGDSTITLRQDQSKPFYHKDAETIIRLYPELYKAVETRRLVKK